MHPRISIIIVTYHTTPLNRLCLWSIMQSGLKYSEVIVIDNAVNDSYAELIAKEYPFIRLIHNSSNEGFGKACNKGFEKARGDLILFLNPDTIVPENLEKKISDFFDAHPRAGAIGVMMTDGVGKFLPESKRNFPSPPAAFLRFLGLSHIIPSSKTKWNYYARHVRAEESHQVEILSGAFMVVSREAMLKTKGFDPQYFMYAEDIDLSLQIAQKGFEVWYNPQIQIIHFKGESTLKTKTYSEDFFKSMSQFYKKHFLKKHSSAKAAIILIFINMISAGSWLKHKLRKKESHNIPCFYLHPDSDKKAFAELNTCTNIRLVMQKAPHVRKKRKYLLISSLNLLPSHLIEIIRESTSQKYNMLLWDRTSGWLHVFKGKNKNCISILPTTVR
jgi:N-acetylglucosaminyl-diphospho-decaprenol L-rhamnosyltransferase